MCLAFQDIYSFICLFQGQCLVNITVYIKELACTLTIPSVAPGQMFKHLKRMTSFKLKLLDFLTCHLTFMYF